MVETTHGRHCAGYNRKAYEFDTEDPAAVTNELNMACSVGGCWGAVRMLFFNFGDRHHNWFESVTCPSQHDASLAYSIAGVLGSNDGVAFDAWRHAS